MRSVVEHGCGQRKNSAAVDLIVFYALQAGDTYVTGSEMSKDDFELVRGSGNVYRDFGRPDAGLEQARAITAAKIIRVLDERKLSTRDAEKLTGISHSEFARIRNAQLRRFTLDRMISILSKLDEEIEVSVTFKPRKHVARDATRAI